MPSKYWIKLYHEILHDPKMARLPDNLWRRSIELFLLAGETGEEGALPPIADVAWSLRIELSEMIDDLAELAKVGILTESPDGWVVTKFAARQAPASSTERVQRYRKREKKHRYYSNDGVTSRYTEADKEADKDTDKEADKEEERAAATAPVIETDSLYGYVYGQITDGMAWKLTPLEAEELGALVDDFPSRAVWDRALYECVCHHARNLKYLDKCLETASADVLAETAGIKSRTRPPPDLKAEYERQQSQSPRGEWDKVLNQLYGEMTRQTVDRWLKPCTVRTEDHTLVIVPQNAQAREWVANRLAGTLDEAVSATLGDGWQWAMAPA